jgi:hypothetical protein
MVKFSCNSGSVTWHVGVQAKISSSRFGGGLPVVILVPGSFCGRSSGQFLVCCHPGPLCIRSFVENPALIRRAYPMFEYSWHLCVFSWWSCYVRRRWDKYQLSSACYQAHMLTSGCVLSCLALNDLIIWGLWLSGNLLGIEDTRAWLPGAQVSAELWHKDELDWSDRWQNHARLQLLRWDKRTSTGHARI